MQLVGDGIKSAQIDYCDMCKAYGARHHCVPIGGVGYTLCTKCKTLFDAGVAFAIREYEKKAEIVETDLEVNNQCINYRSGIENVCIIAEPIDTELSDIVQGLQHFIVTFHRAVVDTISKKVR